MPELTIARTAVPPDHEHDRRDPPVACARELEEMADRLRLDAMLAKYGPTVVIEWIGELCRDRRPRS